MQRNKSSAILGAAVMLVMVTSALVGGASAQGHAGQFKVLYTFTGGNDAYPNGPTLDAAGNLYGTTYGTYPSASGEVFQLTPNSDGSWTQSVLHTFTGDDGGFAMGRMIFDAAGNLYGTTAGGGAYGSGGTAFELAPNGDGSWTETVLHSFCSDGPPFCHDGSAPLASLIFDPAGNLYGTTMEGGKYGQGTVFTLTPNQDGSWSKRVIHDFTVEGGSYPKGGVIFDAAGNLYGTTSGLTQATGRLGTVFKLTPNPDGSWNESVIRQFRGGKGGGSPWGDLIFDGGGNLYGTTTAGGTYGQGTDFRLTPNPDGSWTEYVLHQFTGGRDGANPYYSRLIFDTAGNLFGTTLSGGAYGYGTVFKLKPNPGGGWTEYVLHHFSNGKDGGGPKGLVFDAAGNLYGVTAGGGVNVNYGYGVVFEITAAAVQLTNNPR